VEPRYAVVAFPRLDSENAVEAIRRSYDPLASQLAAHVTIVFPFEGAIVEADLVDHVERAVEGVPPFPLTLTDVSVEPGGYVFLNVGTGADRFQDLHERLYSGPLSQHRSAVHDYRPHVTVGRVTERDALTNASREALLAFSFPVYGTVVDLALFRLDAPERGTVVCTMPLGSANEGASHG
jgi:2'-5' RNA ligase